MSRRYEIKKLNVELRQKLEVENMEEHLQVQKMKWLGHLRRLDPNRLARKV